MEQYLLNCVDCGCEFFTEGERAFYLSKGYVMPTRCKACRDKRKNQSSSIFSEISKNWNIEAKQESAAYFYNISEAQELLDGSKYFVVGRKGTGKTAIAEYLYRSKTPNSFSEKLSFKNFPFNFFYSLDNSKYTPPNQYITIWKYLIFSCVCKMMVKNESIDSRITIQLKKIYDVSAKESLARMVETWTGTDFGIDVLGCGMNGRREIRAPKEMSWIDKCNVLEDVINEHLDNSRYYIIIDELDEDYREFESAEDRNVYLQLLTSLFKAAQDVRATFKETGLNIYPVIFLRTDIYSLLKDSDRNKWNAFRISLDWPVEKIQKMLAHRISVASGNANLSFEDAWNLLFTAQDVTMGNQNQNSMHKFDFITRSTHLRPRDYIQYIIDCSREAIEKKESRISSTTVKEVDDNFSDYLRDEIVDECHSVIPEINEIFEILSQIRKQTFSPQEFIETYNSYVKSERISDKGAENALRLLFEFGVIGNQPSSHSKAIFKYQTVRARFNYKENVMIHRGLYKALQIF